VEVGPALLPPPSQPSPTRGEGDLRGDYTSPGQPSGRGLGEGQRAAGRALAGVVLPYAEVKTAGEGLAERSGGRDGGNTGVAGVERGRGLASLRQ
jgi:hypothetical protein